MSDDENDQLQVDVQEIKMKCEPGDEETCCEVLGKPVSRLSPVFQLKLIVNPKPNHNTNLFLVRKYTNTA